MKNNISRLQSGWQIHGAIASVKQPSRTCVVASMVHHYLTLFLAPRGWVGFPSYPVQKQHISEGYYIARTSSCHTSTALGGGGLNGIIESTQTLGVRFISDKAELSQNFNHTLESIRIVLAMFLYRIMQFQHIFTR